MAGKKKKTTQSREERLMKKREAERKRYERLKNDPQKLEIEKAKWKTKYESRKNKGTVKLITQQSTRDQRATRQQWRVRQKKHRMKSKIQQQTNQFVENNTPSDSDPDDPSQELDQLVNGEPVSLSPESRQATPDPNTNLTNGSPRIQIVTRASSSITPDTNKFSDASLYVMSKNSDGRIAETRKRKRRNDVRKSRELKRLKLDLDACEKRAEKYRKRYERLLKKEIEQKRRLNKEEQMTPRTKVKHFLQGRTVDEDVRRELFTGEVIKSQIAHTFKSINSYKTKKFLKESLSGKIIKKYRMQKALPFIRIRTVVAHNENKLKQRIREKVDHFFHDDENTTVSPGKNDFITRNKIKKQKRYLNNTMNELHKRFRRQNPGVSISYSFYCKLRPFWVVKPSLKGRDTCLCRVHHNMEMLVDKLNKSKVIDAQNPEELAEILCCEKNREACLLRKCNDCNENTIPYNDFNVNDTFTYQKWMLHKEKRKIKDQEKTVQIIKKDAITSTIGKAIDDLEMSIKKFMIHIANIRHQHQYLRKLKENLSCEEALIHIDFSENYALKYAKEVQSMHFGASRNEITLHTGVAYHMTEDNTSIKPVSFCTLSESPRHDPSAIWAHLEPILTDVLQDKRITALHFLSDSPSTQYRNKKNFYLLEKYLQEKFPRIKKAIWNFTEAGHGKGAPDGIGGCLKRTADNMVSLGYDVNNIIILEKIWKENCPNIKLWVVEEDIILRVDSFLSSAGDFKAVKGTMKVHQVTAALGETDTKMNYRTLSCEECKADKNCEHYGIFVSNSTHLTQAQLMQTYNIGEWVIFHYENLIFPGEIIELGPGKLFINAMEPSNSKRTSWSWPKTKDIHDYPIEDVIKKINPPTPIGSSHRVANFCFLDSF